MANVFKKAAVKLDILTIIDMLLTVEKGIRDGICNAIHRYAKANNKYMKNYDKNVESSCLMYLDANNLYGWAMSQKLPANGFKWVEKLSQFNKDFVKNYDENRNKGYLLEVSKQVQYSKNLFNLYKDLPFLPGIKKIEKCNNVVCNIYDKENYVVHIRALKQALNYALIIKKVHRVIEFNQKAWLKP